jgi:DNA modification methylase
VSGKIGNPERRCKICGGKCKKQFRCEKSPHYPFQENYPSRHQATDGINEGDVLRNFTKGRENDDEKHLCPLQLGVIERCVKLWSNPDDVILSPFMGIGSEGYVSVRHNRRFIGCELKPSYFRVACENLRDAERSRINVSDLFSFAENGSNDGLEDCGMEA